VSRELVDLTKQQAATGADNVGGLDEMDDFDLLDATIDPSDFRSQEKVRALELDLAYEQAKISIKQAYRFSKLPEDPMKIKEWLFDYSFI